MRNTGTIAWRVRTAQLTCCVVRLQNKLRVDTGAIKFVLQGANIMCPGLTSPGATIHTEVQSSVITGSKGSVHPAGLTEAANIVKHALPAHTRLLRSHPVGCLC